MHSAHGVDDRIVIAASPLGRAPILEPLSHRPRQAADQPQPGPAKSAAIQPTWSGLLDYYRECVLVGDTETPLIEVGHHNTSYACLTGAEGFLSADVDADGCVALPEESAAS
ncbi:hypothetical protein ACWEDZ_20550 [Streptomyces sp. NPDC005047]